jgi:hypothetical protein
MRTEGQSWYTERFESQLQQRNGQDGDFSEPAYTSQGLLVRPARELIVYNPLTLYNRTSGNTVWNNTDHSIPFFETETTHWEWGLNLFPTVRFNGNAPSVGTLNCTIQLLDSTATVLKTATITLTFSEPAFAASYTASCSYGEWVYDTNGVIDKFNAVKFTAVHATAHPQMYIAFCPHNIEIGAA